MQMHGKIFLKFQSSFLSHKLPRFEFLGVPSWHMHLNVKGPRSGSQCLPAAPWWGRPLRSLHRPCLKLELPDHSGSPSGQGQGLPIREHEHLQRERRTSSLCLQRNTLQLSSIKSGVQFSLVTLEVGRKLCTQFVNGNEQLHCLSLSFKPILQSIHILIRNSVKHNWEITLLSNHPLIIKQREARKNCQFEGYPLSRPHHFRWKKTWFSAQPSAFCELKLETCWNGEQKYQYQYPPFLKPGHYPETGGGYCFESQGGAVRYKNTGH